ncbi:hypothetical protein CPB83DRAFT_844353 [Crepidotus variabilis]|uniref:Uncharacterized protein n=1 Tax=Crepidotus variabilis TaxID=179855 RepID=A0A9P6JW31_9AGAR|nr:hypothetical protein CPB83DRAFT_844353 [Crepidotus variabilis]
MRDNYGEHGVAEYYTKVGATYRNPHYPGIRLCVFDWLNRWWTHEQPRFLTIDPEVVLFDLACGTGEVTLAFSEWCNTGKRRYLESSEEKSSKVEISRKKVAVEPVGLDRTFPKPRILASDPFTFQAFKDRTSFPCSNLSFDSISEGALPIESVNIVDGTTRIFPYREIQTETTGDETNASIITQDEARETQPAIEMVVCSFALHLVESPSSLFALLWELSLKARWLVIPAPHKKPEIKDGWGWCRWDPDSWIACQESSNRGTGELLHERVHCRFYKSTNIS